MSFLPVLLSIYVYLTPFLLYHSSAFVVQTKIVSFENQREHQDHFRMYLLGPSTKRSFLRNHKTHRILSTETSARAPKTALLPTKCFITALSMVATPKSGGRPILSMEQFQAQVLSTKVSTKSSATPNSNSTSALPNAKIRPILVFYSAPWCGPCRLEIPIIREIITQFQSNLDVVDVCTDDLPEVAESAGVVSIPTIQIYHNGKLMDTIVGCVAKNVLAMAVTKVLEDVGLIGGDSSSVDGLTIKNKNQN